MLLMGSIFQCLNLALTIAAALAHRDPFVLPINSKEEADATKRSFAGDSCRDIRSIILEIPWNLSRSKMVLDWSRSSSWICFAIQFPVHSGLSLSQPIC